MLKYMTKYFDFDVQAIETLQKSADSGGVPSTLEIKAKFTDETQDSHGDIITRSATERALPDYREWRNIRYMHQPKAVGLAKHIGTDDGADLNWNEVIIKLVDKDTIHQVQEGVLKGLSVGILFNPWDDKSCEMTEEGNWKIKDYLLAEISVVDHPAHPNASVIEQSLEEVSERRVKEFTPELKSVLRSATSTEELVPLLKSLVQEKEDDMEKEILEVEEQETETAEKEGRDWDKERHMPEDVVESVEIEDGSEEEEIEEPVEEVEEPVEEIEDEEEVEEDAEEEAEEVLEPELEEEVADVEDEVELEDEEVPAEEAEIEEAEEVEAEEVEEEAVEEAVVEEEEEEIEAEEEIESELDAESNELAEKSITVSEEDELDVNVRLDRIEAMLKELLGGDAEVSEAIEVEAEIETPVADEPEELELAESTEPTNRKPNMNLSSEVADVEEEVKESGFTFRRKRTDGQTRIRETLDKFSI